MSLGRKYACNRLFLSACEVVEFNTVVQLDPQGFYSGHVSLERELPCVEWIGGTFFLLPASVNPKGHERDFLSWYLSVLPQFQFGQKYCLWSVLHLQSETKAPSVTAVFRKLG